MTPRSLRLVYALSLVPMIRWSSTSIPRIFPALTIRSVRSMSSLDGSSSPLGWLWIYAKCFFMRSFSLDPADSLVFKGDIASHKTVTDSYVAIGSSPPSVYRNTASLTQELGCS